MTGKAQQIPSKGAAEERNGAVDFTGQLDPAELLTGTPLVVEVGTNDLTITSKAVNTAAITINGATAAIGKAVQFHITGGPAGVVYELLVTPDTNSTPAQKLTGTLFFTAVT